MKKIRIGLKLTFIIFIALLNFLNCSSEINDYIILSPNEKIAVNISFNENKALQFEVTYEELIILQKSKLGLVRKDADFSSGLKLISVSDTESIFEEYSMLHGKKKDCSYTANQKVYHLENTDGKKIDVIFRISNDGVAFRYHFPESSKDVKYISKEMTSYFFTEETKAWIQPMAEAKSGWKRTNPSYEEDYEQEVNIRELKENTSGWVYPALINTNEIWLCISETAPYRDYCGTRLTHEDGSLEFKVGFPPQKETLNEIDGANPNSTLPWSSPWRILTIGNNLSTIVESTMGTDLAKPSVLEDVSYVKPGRASWSWVMLKDDSIVYDVQKRFIDYSADMGWEYSLIDVNWNKNIGYDSIKALADYAAGKDVGLILWYNSSGPWNDTPYEPKNMMLTKDSREKEFSRLKEMGIKGVKVDFFGGDGQDVMSYYLDILENADKYGIMVNTHGCTLPRGWQRTYPNLVTMEAIKGEEFCTFTQENTNRQPTHCCVIPFTRNVFDPMDFTPVVFNEIPSRQRVTTNSFELALSVVFLSGIQHYAETDRGMEKVPDYIKQYMKDIPVSWDQTKFVDGYPGKLVIIARKTGNTWYVAGINGENKSKSIKADLSFIDALQGTLISDITNRETKKETIQIPSDRKMEIPMLSNGGFVLKFIE